MSMRTSAGGRLKILVVISPQLVYQAPGTIYTHAVAMEVRIRWGWGAERGVENRHRASAAKAGFDDNTSKKMVLLVPPVTTAVNGGGLAGGMYQARDAVYCLF